MWIAGNWENYRLLDCGDGCRLEKWGEYILSRPDPQAIWAKSEPEKWKKAHGVYHRSSSGGGSWENKGLPESWQITYTLGGEKQLRFLIKPTGFKHTGLFPEQAANWEFIYKKLKTRQRPKVLNLFAYTGGATLAAAAAGAEVCHVDASKGMVSWARENAALSGLSEAPIRYIVDDCRKFIRREYNRGRRYDGIIMDPPSYGRGPTGEVWKFETGAAELVAEAARILSDDPLFFLISSYTAGVSPSVTSYILGRELGGRAEAMELGLPVESTGLGLPCGSSARWEAK